MLPENTHNYVFTEKAKKGDWSYLSKDYVYPTRSKIAKSKGRFWWHITSFSGHLWLIKLPSRSVYAGINKKLSLHSRGTSINLCLCYIYKAIKLVKMYDLDRVTIFYIHSQLPD